MKKYKISDTKKKQNIHVITNTKTKKKQKSVNVPNTKKNVKMFPIKQYTYFVKTDYFDDKFIDAFFAKRGNWQKILDAEIDDYKKTGRYIDFIYLDGMNYINPRYYSLNANLKNAVDDTKRMVSLKNNLMANLAKIPNGRRFIMPQIELDIFKLLAPIVNQQLQVNIKSAEYVKLKSFFRPGKVYIFKPIMGMGGSGIKVFDKFSELLGYITKIIKFNKHLWNRSKKEIEKEKNRVWVLQEYITNPYLIKKDGKKYKFHVRHFYLYQPDPKQSYYKNIGKMALAEKPYVNGKWLDSKIHDTHFHNFDKYLFTTADTGISEANMTRINAQISEFYKVLDSIVTANCYAESRNCFELFGVDLMITDKFELKVLEVNAGIGLSDNLTENKAELFAGIIDLIVDDYFPPDKLLNIDKKSDKLFTVIKTH